METKNKPVFGRSPKTGTVFTFKSGDGKTYWGVDPIEIDQVAHTIKLNLTNIASKQETKALSDKINLNVEAIATKVSVEQWSTKYSEQDSSIAQNNAAIVENTASTAANTTAINSLQTSLEEEINTIDGLEVSQAQQDVKIKKNADNIKELILDNKKQITFMGSYVSGTVYAKNNAVTSEGYYYISLVDNNTQPLTNTTAWFKTSPEISVDLSQYYTKTQTNTLLEPLETRLVGIETISNQHTTSIATINTNLGNKVDLASSQTISGAKTFTSSMAVKAAASSDRIIGFFNVNAVRLGYIGKESGSSNRIALVAENDELKLSGTTINCNNKRVRYVSTPTEDHNAANKAYTDTKASLTAAQTFSGETTFNAGITMTSAAKIKGVVIPTDDTDAANKGYVDDQVGTSVSLATNQTITGIKTFNSKNIFGNATTIIPSNEAAPSNGLYNSRGVGLILKWTGAPHTSNIVWHKTDENDWLFQIGKLSESNFNLGFKTLKGDIEFNIPTTNKMVFTNATIISNVKAPTQDADAANKKYVDDKVAAGGGGGDVTKSYVDQQLALKANLAGGNTLSGAQNIEHINNAHWIDFTSSSLDIHHKDTGPGYVSIIKKTSATQFRNYGGFKFQRWINGVLSQSGEIVFDDVDNIRFGATGNFLFSGRQLKNIANPTDDLDATNKGYVTSSITSSLSSKADVATTYTKEEVDNALGLKLNLSDLKPTWLLINEFDVNWQSKTTNVSAGTNFKTLVGETIWADIIAPANKYKYVFEILTSSVSQGTDMVIPFHLTNNQGGGSQRVTIAGAVDTTEFLFNNPQTKFTVAVKVMINNTGDVRFYALFDNALNSAFAISKVRVFKLGKTNEVRL